jgi:hypothetical protein
MAILIPLKFSRTDVEGFSESPAIKDIKVISWQFEERQSLGFLEGRPRVKYGALCIKYL